MEAGKAEATAEIQSVQAEKADLEARLATQEERIEALENDKEHLESMKASTPVISILAINRSNLAFSNALVCVAPACMSHFSANMDVCIEEPQILHIHYEWQIEGADVFGCGLQNALEGWVRGMEACKAEQEGLKREKEEQLYEQLEGLRAEIATYKSKTSALDGEALNITNIFDYYYKCQ